jgi:hypothetical protein
MVSHLKTQHLCSDDRRNRLREAIGSDYDFFMVLEESLRVIGQWLCGSCIHIQALSRACHHPDGLVRVTLVSKEVESHIVGIL